MSTKWLRIERLTAVLVELYIQDGKPTPAPREELKKEAARLIEQMIRIEGGIGET